MSADEKAVILAEKHQRAEPGEKKVSFKGIHAVQSSSIGFNEPLPILDT